MLGPLLIFGVTYLLIISEKVDRTAAAVIGALIGIDAYFHALVPDVSAPPPDAIPRRLADWQGRDIELSEEDLDQIQAMVNEDWELLLRKAGEHA